MVPSPDSYSGAERVDDVVGVQECVRGWARLPAVVLETVFGLIFRPPCLTAAYRKKAVYFGGLGFMSVSVARTNTRKNGDLECAPASSDAWPCRAVDSRTRAPVLSSQGRRHTHTHIHTHESTTTFDGLGDDLCVELPLAQWLIFQALLHVFLFQHEHFLHGVYPALVLVEILCEFQHI